MCSCEQGYENDVSGADGRVTVGEKLDLVCKDVDECADQTLNDCKSTQTCINTNSGLVSKHAVLVILQHNHQELLDLLRLKQSPAMPAPAVALSAQLPSSQCH